MVRLRYIIQKALFCSILVFCHYVYAQPPLPNSALSAKDNRWFTGGNIGFQFGDQTFIDISPLCGYKVIENFHAGISATYKYYQYKKAFYDPYRAKWLSYTGNIIGGSVFARYFVIPEVFANLEYEMLWLSFDDFYDNGNTISKARETRYVPSLLAGGGYRQYISDKTSFDIVVLWNFLESQYSPYDNPIIRIGFSVDL
ncbi:MAG: hypothetical protein M0R21_02200 [Lentimicrobiaceae bacterium]|nr:hypothetical protein [Lentimicrobiaceae bacterium]